MKILLAILLQLIVLGSFSQDLIGSWKMTSKDDSNRDVRTVVIFSEKYQVATTYDAQTGAFISTNGGSWSIDGSTVTETVEFHSEDSSKVGLTFSFDVEWSEEKMRVVGKDAWLTRIDNGTPGELNGAWLMSGRKRNGAMQERDTSRPRKTMKILSGTRFQWIAYNTATKQFMATGGGTYTSIDGKYTENIEFFSRDNSRVGASLEFDYELREGKWHHSGFSSKGDPLYEVWSLRNE